ncbi:MAG: hypothetical protein JSW40_07525 [Candidatus Omnitrophota bacterium]|nr:MAG: hypothetical protein JSW40_07525 [Candidatus Omnitrophota bacterium]
MKILVTAGPTWIKIDEVRILTNIFTGRTGIYLAKEFKKKGHSVTLLLNPYRIVKKEVEGLRVIPFHYYEELQGKISSELKKTRYDAIIHAAAVSDYRARSPFKGKVSSGKKELLLRLVPTAKLIRTIRTLAKKSILVQFKLETEKKQLIEKAYRNLKENKADYVVANSLSDLKCNYKAYLIDKNKRIVTLSSKKTLSTALYKLITFPHS